MNRPYCLVLAEKAFVEAEEKPGFKVVTFMSDNEATLKTMREKNRDKFKQDFFMSYGCISYYLNLVGEEIKKI